MDTIQKVNKSIIRGVIENIDHLTSVLTDLDQSKYDIGDELDLRQAVFNLVRTFPDIYLSSEDYIKENLEFLDASIDITEFYSPYKMTDLGMRIEGITDRDTLIKEILIFVQKEINAVLNDNLVASLKDSTKYIE